MTRKLISWASGCRSFFSRIVFIRHKLAVERDDQLLIVNYKNRVMRDHLCCNSLAAFQLGHQLHPEKFSSPLVANLTSSKIVTCFWKTRSWRGGRGILDCNCSDWEDNEGLGLMTRWATERDVDDSTDKVNSQLSVHVCQHTFPALLLCHQVRAEEVIRRTEQNNLFLIITVLC